jgi:hypothetical protein
MTKKLTREMEVKSVAIQGYTGLLSSVSQLLEQARYTAARSVNTILTATYWEIGHRIVEFEQKGARRAEYGKRLLERLAQDLTYRFGRGFGYSNLNLIRQFYVTYQHRHPILQSPIGESKKGIPQTVSAQFLLSWTHYVRLIGLDNQAKRDFYEEEARRTGWSVRQLDRQIDAMLSAPCATCPS